MSLLIKRFLTDRLLISGLAASMTVFAGFSIGARAETATPGASGNSGATSGATSDKAPTSTSSPDASVTSEKGSTSEKPAATDPVSGSEKNSDADKPSVPGEPPVLDPNKFFGHAKSGYAAAQLCPEICAKLFCYCGCDMTDDHDSLLDCFTTDHGVDCHICQEEALVALKMKREGKTIKQIQQAVDIMFEKEYPFDDPSAIIQKYRKNRLWQPGTLKTLNAENKSAAAKVAGGKSANGKTSASSTTATKRNPGAPLVGKNGQPVGTCCAGHSKAKK